MRKKHENWALFARSGFRFAEVEKMWAAADTAPLLAYRIATISCQTPRQKKLPLSHTLEHRPTPTLSSAQIPMLAKLYALPSPVNYIMKGHSGMGSYVSLKLREHAIGIGTFYERLPRNLSGSDNSFMKLIVSSLTSPLAAFISKSVFHFHRS